MILFRWSAHLGQYLFGQRLGDLKDIAGGTSGFDTRLDGLSHGGNVPVGGIIDDGNLGHDGERSLK